MDKGYIEREVERKIGSQYFPFTHKLGGVGIGMIITGLFWFFFFFLIVGKVTVLSFIGLFIFVIGICYLIYSNSNKYKKDVEQGKQYVRDKITRQEELREAQLNALKEGHKEINLIGEIKKLK